MMCFRETESVIVSPSSSLLRSKSAILEFSLLDTSLHLEERPVPLENVRKTVRNKQNQGELANNSSDPGSPPPPLGDQIILVVSSERSVTCYSLPSQKQIYNFNVPDVYSMLYTRTVSWLGEERDNSILMCLTSDGRIKGEHNIQVLFLIMSANCKMIKIIWQSSHPVDLHVL